MRFSIACRGKGWSAMPQNAEPSRPYSLMAELTYRCPLACPYCSNPLKLRLEEKELDTSTWKRVLTEAAELGVVQVHFSGGEPLVRHDLDELVTHAPGQNLYTHLIRVGMGADEGRLLQLRDAGLDALQISLQDSRPAQNDWIGGAPSFEQERGVFRAARRLDFPVTLNVVVHRHNLDAVEELIELAAEC